MQSERVAADGVERLGGAQLGSCRLCLGDFGCGRRQAGCEEEPKSKRCHREGRGPRDTQSAHGGYGHLDPPAASPWQ